jgi:imidazole glycerol-phosphate synthase subunit HisH
VTPLIAVIDYGAGNLRSIQRALEAAGANVTITSDPAEIMAADGVVFPGVGNAGAAMDRLTDMNIPPAIAQAVNDRKPFLGICLGMQLMFEYQEEGETQGLGLLPGRVRTLASDVKSPQIGWNRVRFVRAGALGTGGEEDDFYFVHSYIVDPENPDDIVATTQSLGLSSWPPSWSRCGLQPRRAKRRCRRDHLPRDRPPGWPLCPPGRGRFQPGDNLRRRPRRRG